MNVVVIEDSPVMKSMLLHLLDDVPNLRVVGTASGEAEAVSLIARVRPDLVLLDLFLSPGHGLKVLQSMRTAGNQCKVIILTNEPHEEYRVRGNALGAHAFHNKSDDFGPLLDELRQCAETC